MRQPILLLLLCLYPNCDIISNSLGLALYSKSVIDALSILSLLLRSLINCYDIPNLFSTLLTLLLAIMPLSPPYIPLELDNEDKEDSKSEFSVAGILLRAS